MACYHPLSAHLNDAGEVIFNAKGQIGGGLQSMTLPCGRCFGCRMRRRRDWAIRCTHEAQMHDKSSFVTLTYSDDQVPADRGLVLEHWQKFAKSLRKRIGPFRFFHCGEYGEKKLRPHYHALIFGENFGENSHSLKQPAYKSKTSQVDLRVSPTITETWANSAGESRGFHTIGQVSFRSASYVASYCTKKMTGDEADFYYTRPTEHEGEVVDVRPEYATMSLKPGLGWSWFEKYGTDIYPSNFVVLNGTKYAPPRYYDKLLKEQNPELYEEMIFQRFEQSDRQGARCESKRERLKVREICAKAQLSQATSHSL